MLVGRGQRDWGTGQGCEWKGPEMMIGVGLCGKGRGEGQGALEGKEKEKSVQYKKRKGRQKEVSK